MPPSTIPSTSSAISWFCRRAWTVATYMVEGGGSRDFRRVKSWAYRDPQAFDALVDLLAEATIESFRVIRPEARHVGLDFMRGGVLVLRAVAASA
jgi:hypothetical protein